MKYLKHEVENLFHYFFKEKGDMERSGSYKKVIEELPQVEIAWLAYKACIDEAEMLFEYRMNKIIEGLPEDNCA